MMTRRRAILLFAGIILIAVTGALESQRIITGCLRGESFYRWRPYSFWAGVLSRWRYTAGPWHMHWVREPAAWEKYVPFDLMKTEPRIDLPGFDLADPETLRIAEELSEDSDPAVAGPGRYICQRMGRE